MTRRCINFHFHQTTSAHPPTQTPRILCPWLASSSHSCTARVAIGVDHTLCPPADYTLATSTPSAVHLWRVRIPEWLVRRTGCRSARSDRPGAISAISTPCRSQWRPSSRPSFDPPWSGPCSPDRRPVVREFRSCRRTAGLGVRRGLRVPSR